MKKSNLLTWAIAALSVIAMFIPFLPAVSSTYDSPSIYSITFSEYNPRGGLVTAWVFLLVSMLIAVFVAVLANVFKAKAGAAYLAILAEPFFITACTLYSCTYVFANKGVQYVLGIGAILEIVITGLCIIGLGFSVVHLFIEASEESK